MTDRERLLEQVREAEARAAYYGDRAVHWLKALSSDVERPAHYAAEAAHHALTALALREALQYVHDRTPLLVIRHETEPS